MHAPSPTGFLGLGLTTLGLALIEIAFRRRRGTRNHGV